MKIQFLGAARSVTGSMHLISVNGKHILLECGLYQGRRQEAFEKNLHLPFDPRKIDCLILSHAHIDHSGNIPRLVKNGFAGNIYTTFATRDLCSVMLRDSAYIQEKDVEYVNKKHLRKGIPLAEPLYTIEDAERSLNNFVGLNYERPFFVTNGVAGYFYDAGHILGSAVILLEIGEGGHKLRLGFTGDLGRKNLPVLKDPVPMKDVDILITESTYGNRLHDPYTQVSEKLAEVVNSTVHRGGKIIIPAFSVGRTQEIVYCLHQLFDQKRIPEIPIFVDSPLSCNVTEVFRLHPECYDWETTQRFLLNDQDPFGFGKLTYIRELEDSKKLNSFKGSCIILSASGMCEAGRILHHLKNNIENPRNTILIVGYMAQNTLGKKLVDKWERVKIFGEEYRLRAEVVVVNAFSAHADRRELLEYVNELNPGRLKTVFVIHGDEDQCEALAAGIRDFGVKEVLVPKEGEEFEI